MESIIFGVNKTVSELCAGDGNLEKRTSLRSDLGFDSLKMVELIVKLEQYFGLEFEESDLDPQDIDTLEDVYRLVAKYVRVKV